MMWEYDLPLVDSYFMLDCSDANGRLAAGEEWVGRALPVGGARPWAGPGEVPDPGSLDGWA